MMVLIKELHKTDKDLYVVDHSDCSAEEMIKGIAELGRRIRSENRPAMILSIFNDRAYITAGFMKMAEEENLELSHLIDKQAIVGLNDIKKMILKGFNLTLRRNVRNFDSEDEAMKFLLDEATTDKDFDESLT